MQKENHYKEEKYKDVKASKENLFFEEQNCDEKVVTRLKGREKIYKLKKKKTVLTRQRQQRHEEDLA